MLFSANCRILLSKSEHFPENSELSFRIDRELGEGSYGRVYQMNQEYAIKIFKNCKMGSVNLSCDEEYVLPSSEENRELLFYIEMLKRNKDLSIYSHHHILQPYVIGFITDPIQYKTHLIESGTYVVVLPLCVPFYKILPIKNIELLSLARQNELFEYVDIPYDHTTIPFGIFFVLHVMRMLCKASIYLEEEFKVYNLDFKINNIMFLKKRKMNESVGTMEDLISSFEDLIVIDFGLIKHIYPSTLHGVVEESVFTYDDLIDTKYFIWPYSGTTFISHIPSYSICINGLELLFGKKEVEKLPSYRLMKRIIHKLKDIDQSLYFIFHHGLIHKTSTKKLHSYIDNYLSTFT